MRFSAAETEVMDKVVYHYPQIKSILGAKLKDELSDLLQANAGHVQVAQGRCQALQELMEYFDQATRPAKRIVQPLNSTP